MEAAARVLGNQNIHTMPLLIEVCGPLGYCP